MNELTGWRTQFVLLAAIWGSSFLFVKVLDRHWSALWVCFSRVALGAGALVVVMLVRRERFPSDRRLWAHCAVAALSFNTISWTLIAYGEQHVTSIMAGLWNATTPLWVLTLSVVAFRDERPSGARLAGLLIGFAGVATLLGPWRGFGGSQLIGHLACAAAAVCYGVGFPYTRRHLSGRQESGIVLSACQLICAMVMLAPFLALAPVPTSHIGWDGVGSILALGALGSGIAFALNYMIVRERGATAASTVTYLIPVFSTLLGAVLLGEELHWNQPAGTIVLLLGVAMSQGRLPAMPRPDRARPVSAGSSTPGAGRQRQTRSVHAPPALSPARDAGPPSPGRRAHQKPAGGDSATTVPRRT
ncbi:MAG: EamA family transporter [Candidatus Woesearchaeota archaeon]